MSITIPLNRYYGVHTALPTSFSRKGRLDLNQLASQIEFQIEHDVAGVIPVGTTGESPTLRYHEHLQVFKTTVEVAKGKTLVIAGAGANSTHEAVRLTRAAEKLGADALLQVGPYYNKPSQEGMFLHFKTIANATGLPIFLYHIPGRCGGEGIAVQTVCRLRDAAQNIIGIKDAGGNPDRVSELRCALGRDFFIFSGDDSLTLPFMSVGANGVISVVSNIVPTEIVKMVGSFRNGFLKTAMDIHLRLFPLIKALFLDGNPSGVKCALQLLGRDSGVLRLPLVPVNKPTEDAIRAQLLYLGLLSRA